MSDDVVLTWILATPNGKPYTTTVPRELWEEQDQAALINQLGAGLLDHMRMADGRGAVVLTAMVNTGPVRPGEEPTT